MTDKDPQFTGAFAGEDSSAATHATSRTTAKAAKPTAQHAAIAKYAAHAEKQARKPASAKKPPMRTGTITIILLSCIAVCIAAGTLLYKLSPARSFEANVGEYLLIAAILFIFALLRVRATRRR